MICTDYLQYYNMQPTMCQHQQIWLYCTLIAQLNNKTPGKCSQCFSRQTNIVWLIRDCREFYYCFSMAFCVHLRSLTAIPAQYLKGPTDSVSITCISKYKYKSKCSKCNLLLGEKSKCKTFEEQTEYRSITRNSNIQLVRKRDKGKHIYQAGGNQSLPSANRRVQKRR